MKRQAENNVEVGFFPETQSLRYPRYPCPEERGTRLTSVACETHVMCKTFSYQLGILGIATCLNPGAYIFSLL